MNRDFDKQELKYVSVLIWNIIIFIVDYAHL